MSEIKKEHPAEKTVLHPRNKHRERYDFKQLTGTCPELGKYVKRNTYGDESIDFANPKAVKWLNKALLKHYYGVDYWDIPAGYLCPPIPGRADYIHYAADLLAGSNNGKIPTGFRIKCMDIGVGASCVFPIIGNKEYGWSFIGSESDSTALESANKIINYNPFLKRSIDLRFQENTKDIFHGIMERNEPIDITICNPPFHSSPEEAQAGTLRKLSSLQHKKITTPTLNFGGQNTELWCEGGEERFVRDMIRQSRQFGSNCFWFTTQISKQAHLEGVYDALKNAGAQEVKTIPMGQGTKVSRIVAWTFLKKDQQNGWINSKWNAI
ncbi:MAG: 23S rRNA (adenine(1618)-N(6))-methyltransferase RlmF [Bacteroidota bacterium]|nr:23S rRNA (adenine(1618)-N(6))-methyltransferase RlmF [Bacteroidota bacterium]